MTPDAILAPDGTLAADGVLVADGVLGSAAYAITNGVEFYGASAVGGGGRMDTAATYSGATGLTVSFFARIDTYTASFGVGQWNGGYPNNAWIVAPSDSATYGPGSDGVRFWFDTATLPTYAQWGTTLNDGAVVHVVARFDGGATGDANRARIWAAAYESGVEVVSWGEQTLMFDGSTAIPASLASGASLPGVQIGGAEYVSAQDIDGVIGDVAIWGSALDAAVIATMHSTSRQEPIDFADLAPANWWQMGQGTDDAGTTIVDQGSSGDDGTLTTGGTGSTPAIVAWT